MKEFNVEAICIPELHYMVNIDKKVDEIIKLIHKGKYFAINRARQFGKTTTLFSLEKKLLNQYYVLSISFEGIDDTRYEERRLFIEALFMRFQIIAENENYEWLVKLIKIYDGIDTFDELAKMIREMCRTSDKPIVLMIDEVDKTANNGLFLNFLAMLRDLYLMRQAKKAKTFQSVILAGVYDVKNLKLKLRSDEQKTYNSPWNIAADFLVDMSFDQEEIITMLDEYEEDYHTSMDKNVISEEIYRFTSGYPYLVTRICKIIDERLSKDWSIFGVKNAVNIMLSEKSTLMDDLIKNLNNDSELFENVHDLVIKGVRKAYNPYNYELGIVFGIFKVGKAKSLEIHNIIFETLIYNYLIERQGNVLKGQFRSKFVKEDGDLDFEEILNKFQELMYQEYRKKDADFLEAQGRLIFLAFIKPIINGEGHYFIEPVLRNDERMDVVITFNKKIYIIELKIWRGKSYYDKGLLQLCGYLEKQKVDEGFLIIFNFNDNKSYHKESLEIEGKRIYSIEV